VAGVYRVAYRATITLGAGRQIVEHVILELRKGRIATQVDVEVWD
jgi:hypothetical protein